MLFPEGKKHNIDITEHKEEKMLKCAVIGICTNRKSVIKFRNGVFNNGMPVQPVLFEWSFKVLC